MLGLLSKSSCSENLFDAGALKIRPMSKTDARMLWEWANDPVNRSMAISKGQIVWKDHVEWLEGKMASENTLILILECNSVPVGQIRFDLNVSGEAEIDFYIATKYRRQSLGSYLLREGTRCYIKINSRRISAVFGRVKAENIASCRAFEKAGFRHMGKDNIGDQGLIRFVWPN